LDLTWAVSWQEMKRKGGIEEGRREEERR